MFLSFIWKQWFSVTRIWSLGQTIGSLKTNWDEIWGNGLKRENVNCSQSAMLIKRLLSWRHALCDRKVNRAGSPNVNWNWRYLLYLLSLYPSISLLSPSLFLSSLSLLLSLPPLPPSLTLPLSLTPPLSPPLSPPSLSLSHPPPPLPPLSLSLSLYPFERIGSQLVSKVAH